MERKRTSATKVEAEEWEVRAITDSRLKLEYTVLWNDGSSTNEPRENLIPGSEEAVSNFHRIYPAKPTLRSINQAYRSDEQAKQLNDLRGMYDHLLNECQMLKAHRLPDAIQTALFIPHQKLVLEENAQLKAFCQSLQDRANQAEAWAQHWKTQADALSATVDQQSQQMVAYVERQLAQNTQSETQVRGTAGNTASGAMKNSRTLDSQLPASATALQSGSTASKDALTDAAARPIQASPHAGSDDGSFSNTQPSNATSISLQSKTPITPAQLPANATPASGSNTLSQAPKPSSTSSPVPKTYYDTLAELKCHHCYHEHSSCSYAPGVKCATCEKFGRRCREVARDEDGNFPLPRATVRKQKVREAKLLQAEQAKSQRDDSDAVLELVKSADGTLKSKDTDDTPLEKAHTQLAEQEDEDPTSLFIFEPKSASGNDPERPAQATPAEQTQPPTRKPGNGKIDWAAEAKVRCHVCYHQGLRCTYVPGQACCQCSRTDTQRRVCKPVVTYDGVAPPPNTVVKAERRKEKLRTSLANGTPVTASNIAPVAVTNVAPATVTNGAAIAADTLSNLPRENEALRAEVRTLKAAQEATEDIWTKQISLLEQALSKYSVEGALASEPLLTCRKCGSTNSVGLREVPNGRLHLCHACGLQQARQGKSPEQQPDHGLREENKRLKAENIALSTEAAALKKRLATVENAVVGWGAPPIDSGYEENLVDLTAA